MSQQFSPTTEQLTAIELFSTGRSIAIEAGAGAGKTSTLKLIAEATERQGQYVAFNKAIVTEAGAKMPANITCSTAHSLAYRGIITSGGADGRKFGNRLRNAARMKSDEIARRLRIDDITVTVDDEDSSYEKHLPATFLAGLAMRAIIRFCQSADAQPEERHVPYIEGIDIPPGAMQNNRVVRRHLIAAVRRAWDDITNPDGQLPWRHDYYLKMFQLSNPRIGADFILFDEAQDANPVMVAIVAQQQAQLVWVGDSQQQIYSFTGAINALASVPSDDRAFLTQSFRFGPAVAEVANRILDTLDAELNIVGTPSIPSVVGPIAEPDVILSRTNAAAITELFAARANGKRVHLVGGGKDVIAFARAAQALMQGRRTEHPELACFTSWTEVQEYVEQDEQGGDLKLMVGLIDRFGVTQIIEALDRMPREENADLVVSTAHKAKGREWDRVKLAGDFPETPQGEELRLLYVAVTRAKLALDIEAVTFLNEEGGSTDEPTDEPSTDEPQPLDTFDAERLAGIKTAGAQLAQTYMDSLYQLLPVYGGEQRREPADPGDIRFNVEQLTEGMEETPWMVESIDDRGVVVERNFVATQHEAYNIVESFRESQSMSLEERLAPFGPEWEREQRERNGAW